MRIKEAFSMADSNKLGGICMGELNEVLEAIDVDVDVAVGDKF